MTQFLTHIPTVLPASPGAPANSVGALALTLLLSGAALLLVWGALRVREVAARRAQGLDGSRAHGAGARWPLFRRRGGADAAELASVARDVEELAERLAARMDERAERLERLIEMADERIAQLEYAAPGTSGTPGNPGNPGNPRTHGNAESTPARVVRAVNGPTTVRGALGRMAAETAVAPTPAPESKRVIAAAGAYAPDPINGKVYELADLGKQPAEIAAALDEHIGKVQLILALRDA